MGGCEHSPGARLKFTLESQAEQAQESA